MSGLNRLDRLADRRRRGDFAARPGVVAYLTAGDGGADATLEALFGAQEGGAVAIELGFPCSDPVADGPVLLAAAARARRAGTGFDDVLAMLRRYREGGGDLPVVAFGYANVLLEARGARGLDALAAAGADGVAVADLPVEEAGDLLADLAARDLRSVLFSAPTTDDDRLAAVARASTGFHYAVARCGTTGRATALDTAALADLERARRAAAAEDRTFAVGFGLARRAHLDALVGRGDLAVVGSALVADLAGAPLCERRARARAFVADLVGEPIHPTGAPARARTL